MGEDSDSAPPFTDERSALSSLPATDASVTWTPPAWLTVGEAGSDERTPNLAVILQEVVDRDGWAPLGNMGFVLRGTGSRIATAFETDPAAAPRLHITYTLATDTGVGGDGDTPPVIVELRIGLAVDDVEERSTGYVALHSSDLELSDDGYQAQTIGLRFTQLAIPEGAVVTRAYIQFQVDEVSTGDAALSIRGFDADQQEAFAQVEYDVSSRPTTDAAVAWTPAEWTTVGEAGVDQQTPDLAAIVQEIIQHESQGTLDAIGFVIQGQGTRTAEAYDGDRAGAPLLHVEYVLPPTDGTPPDGTPPDVTPPDVTPPTVSITGPVDGSTVSGVITVGVDAADNTGVHDVQLRIDSEIAGAPDPDQPYSFTIDTTLLNDNNITLTAVATDLAGNWTISAPVTLEVDNEPPPPPPPPPSGVIRVPGDYASIQAAIDAAGDGDTVLVGPGTYQGGLTITGKSITLASLYLTTGDPKYIANTIIDGGTPAVTVAKSAPGSVVEGFHFTGATKAVVFAGEGSQALDNLIENTHGDGISFEGVGGVARGNHIIAASDDGIDIDHPKGDILLEGNVIESSRDDGVELRNGGYDGPLVTITMRDNEIVGAREDGIQLIDYDPVSDRAFVIEHNLIRGSAFAGLGIMGGGETKENFSAASMLERVLVLNNTFDGNNYGITGGDNLFAVNNIVSNSATLGMKNIDGGSIVADTLFWNNANDQSGSHLDADTIHFGDPGFTATWGLGAGSAAIDAGTSTFQYDGETLLHIPQSDYLGTAPDLGWLESA